MVTSTPPAVWGFIYHTAGLRARCLLTFDERLKPPLAQPALNIFFDVLRNGCCGFALPISCRICNSCSFTLTVDDGDVHLLPRRTDSSGAARPHTDTHTHTPSLSLSLSLSPSLCVFCYSTNHTVVVVEITRRRNGSSGKSLEGDREMTREKNSDMYQRCNRMMEITTMGGETHARTRSASH